MDFDKTLGYPGEGPSRRTPRSYQGCGFTLTCPTVVPGFPAFRCALFVCLCWILGLVCCGDLCAPFPCVPVLLVLLTGRQHCALVALYGAMAMPVMPSTAGEVRRADQRRHFGPLPEGRPVQPTTGSHRERYLNVFRNWVAAEGIDLEALLENSHVWVEDLNILLCRFGRQLFEAGKTYNQYAETINSITSIRPSLRRQMQGAWDLGYAWMRQEPSQHHVAMPGVNFAIYDFHISYVGVARICRMPCSRMGFFAETR